MCIQNKNKTKNWLLEHFDILNSSIEVALQIECIFGVVISSRSDQSGESKEDIVLEEKDL